MPATPPTEWAVQDWLLVVEGLATRFHPDDDSEQATRGWKLLQRICECCGVDTTEYVFSIDDEWSSQQAAAGNSSQPDSQPAERLSSTEWQLVADALTEIATRERETTRTRRARELSHVVADENEDVSLQLIE